MQEQEIEEEKSTDDLFTKALTEQEMKTILEESKNFPEFKDTP